MKKVVIAVTVEVDEKKWTAEYGPGDVPKNVALYVHTYLITTYPADHDIWQNITATVQPTRPTRTGLAVQPPATNPA